MLRPFDFFRFPALRKPLLLSLFLNWLVNNDWQFSLNTLWIGSYWIVITRNGSAHSCRVKVILALSLLHVSRAYLVRKLDFHLKGLLTIASERWFPVRK